jgi:hypothetical protein
MVEVEEERVRVLAYLGAAGVGQDSKSRETTEHWQRD